MSSLPLSPSLFLTSSSSSSHSLTYIDLPCVLCPLPSLKGELKVHLQAHLPRRRRRRSGPVAVIESGESSARYDRAVPPVDDHRSWCTTDLSSSCSLSLSFFFCDPHVLAIPFSSETLSHSLSPPLNPLFISCLLALSHSPSPSHRIVFLFSHSLACIGLPCVLCPLPSLTGELISLI